MKRIITLILMLSLLGSFAACGRASVPAESYTSEKPDASSEITPTEAPTENPSAAPTEEAFDGLYFTNELSFQVKIAVFNYLVGYKVTKYDSVNIAEAGKSIHFKYDFPQVIDYIDGETPDPSTENNSSFSISCFQSDGTYYYIDGVELHRESRITLSERAGQYYFGIENVGSGSVEYPALSIKNGDPLPADERILGLKKETYSGGTAAERACRDGSLHADISYQLISPDEDTAAKYSKLKNALEDERTSIYGRVIALFHSLVEEAEHTEHSHSNRGSFSMEAFVRRADSRCVSILYRFRLDFLDNTQVYWASSSFDTASGNRISIENAVIDLSAFTEALNSKLAGETVSTDDWRHHDRLDMPAFTIDHDGISVFLYGDNSDISAFLPFSEYPGLFSEELLPETEDFTVEFPYEARNCFIMKDGESSFRITALCNDNAIDYYGRQYSKPIATDVELNGEHFRNSIVFPAIFSERPDLSDFLYVRCGGRDYLYIIGSDFIDFIIGVFEIHSGRLFYLGCALLTPGESTAVSPIEVIGTEDHIITDPHCFHYNYCTTVLGEIVSECSAGAYGDGIPALLDSVFMIEGVEYELLVDIEAELINEAGERLGTIELHSGDTVSYFRTDNKEWADVKTSDGQIARFYYTFNYYEWPYVCIDGISVTRIFKGVSFVD